MTEIDIPHSLPIAIPKSDVGIPSEIKEFKAGSPPKERKIDEDEFIVFLNLIGQAKKGEHFFINETEKYFYTPWVMEYFFPVTQDVKDKNLSWIKEVVKKGLDRYDSLSRDKRSKHKAKLAEISSAFTKAKTGLNILRETFKHDRLYACRLDSVVDSINSTMTVE